MKRLWGSLGPKEYHDCKGGTVAADKPAPPGGPYRIPCDHAAQPAGDDAAVVQRVREEFEYVAKAGRGACIKSAMLNVKPLTDRIADLRAKLAEAEKTIHHDEIWGDLHCNVEAIITERDRLAARVAELERERGLYCDILMTVCHALELPRCEDGPCEDALAYTRAIDGLEDENRLRSVMEQRDKALQRVSELERAEAVQHAHCCKDIERGNKAEVERDKALAELERSRDRATRLRAMLMDSGVYVYQEGDDAEALVPAVRKALAELAAERKASGEIVKVVQEQAKVIADRNEQLAAMTERAEKAEAAIAGIEHERQIRKRMVHSALMAGYLPDDGTNAHREAQRADAARAEADAAKVALATANEECFETLQERDALIGLLREALPYVDSARPDEAYNSALVGQINAALDAS